MPGILTCFPGQRAATRHALHLDDHDSACAPRRLRHRQHLSEHRLLFHRHVSILVRGRSAQEGDVDRHRLEEEPFLAGEIDDLDEIRRRARALPRTLLAGIDERVESGLRQQTRSPGRHVAHELRQHALRQRVRFDLVRGGEARQPRRVDQRARDRSLDEALVRKMRRAERGAIADAHDAHRGQSARLAFGQESPLHRGEQGLGHRMAAARSAEEDRVAVLDQCRCFVCRDFFHGSGQCRDSLQISSA